MSYQQKRFYLFNCDNTYSLETVEKLLLEAGDKYGFKISVDRLCFGLQRMAEVCDRTLPHLVMDYAIFVVHADESRLSINEDNAGIGYARLYRALLQKTGMFHSLQCTMVNPFVGASLVLFTFIEIMETICEKAFKRAFKSNGC